MQAIINFAFKPIDDPKHWLDAYEADKEEKHREGSGIDRALLGITIQNFPCIIPKETRGNVF